MATSVHSSRPRAAGVAVRVACAALLAACGATPPSTSDQTPAVADGGAAETGGASPEIDDAAFQAGRALEPSRAAWSLERVKSAPEVYGPIEGARVASVATDVLGVTHTVIEPSIH